MNNPSTFVMGWSSFFVAVMVGAGIGYNKAQGINAKARIDKVGHDQRNDDMLAEVAKQWKKDGKGMMKKKKKIELDKPINKEKGKEEEKDITTAVA